MTNGVHKKTEDFKWEPLNGVMKKLITTEFFSKEKNVYEKYHSVSENDVVVDLGSSVGPFGYQLKDRNIKKLYCDEAINISSP